MQRTASDDNTLPAPSATRWSGLTTLHTVHCCRLRRAVRAVALGRHVPQVSDLRRGCGSGSR